MYQLNSKEDNQIEIVLGDAITDKEFASITAEIESLPRSKTSVNVIFDARNLRDRYTFKIFLDECKFCQKYKSRFNHVAFISDDASEVFLLEQFVKHREPEFKTFNEIEEARNWAFINFN